MRVVLDTNVVVSGLFFKGIPYRILQGIKEGKYRPVVTDDIVEEYKRTVNRLANQFPDIIDADDQLRLIIFASEICQPKHLIGPVCEDPDDDKFIACAITSGAKIIVSGDKLLLKASGYRNVQVLKPKEFASKYLSS